MTPRVRKLKPTEVQELILWAKAEGWNPGMDDAEAFLAADPKGFIGCFEGRDMLAAISAVKSGNDFGFIGLYITHPDHRGKGFGRKVWNSAMRYLGDRTIGLDGVPEQQANYQSKGFAPAYRTWRFSGRFKPEHVDAAVVALHGADLPQLTAFDALFYPGPREAFIAQWVSEPRVARAVYRDGKLVACGVLRQCHDGHKIGPLFAESDDDAYRLFIALCAETGGEFVSIDVPEQAQAFSDYLTDIAFEKSFVTARMYRGPAPGIGMTGVYGITTLELG